jgi:hypothetical protein
MAEIESIAEFPFEFYDQLFTIVLGNDRKLYAPIPLMCAALHVQPTGQIQRIQRDPVLVDAMRLVKFEHYPYGDQGELRSREVQALRLDRLPYFLGGIDISRISNDETKEAVIRFKLEFADRAWAAFRSELLPPDMLAELDTSLSPDQQVYYGMMDRATEIRRDLLAHEGLLKGHEDRIEKIEKDIDTLKARLISVVTLNKSQMRQAQKMISLVAKLLEKKGVSASFANVHGRVKDFFDVPSYTLIAESDFPKLRRFLAQQYNANTPTGTPLPTVFEEPDQRSLF